MEIAAPVSTRHEELLHSYSCKGSTNTSASDQKTRFIQEGACVDLQVGPSSIASKAAAGLSAALKRGLEGAIEFPGGLDVGAAGAADSTTPRVMKDEISGNASTPATAPSTGNAAAGVGGWQSVPEGNAAPTTAEVSSDEPAAPPPEELKSSQLDPRAPVRKGKWTPEEEMYTTRIINDFNKGLLPLAPGTTLRSYLSEKLNW